MLNRAMQDAQLAALCALGGIVGAPPAMAQDYDADGCWNVAQGCAELRQNGDEDSDTVDITRVTNRCGGRIAIRLCNETENDSGTDWICHNYTLSDGESRSQTTFFATGRAKLYYVGSRSSASDATCQMKRVTSGG